MLVISARLIQQRDPNLGGAAGKNAPHAVGCFYFSRVSTGPLLGCPVLESIDFSAHFPGFLTIGSMKIQGLFFLDIKFFMSTPL